MAATEVPAGVRVAEPLGTGPPSTEDYDDCLLEFSEFSKFLTSGAEAARTSDQFVDVSLACSDSGKLAKKTFQWITFTVNVKNGVFL